MLGQPDTSIPGLVSAVLLRVALDRSMSRLHRANAAACDASFVPGKTWITMATALLAASSKWNGINSATQLPSEPGKSRSARSLCKDDDPTTLDGAKSCNTSAA